MENIVYLYQYQLQSFINAAEEKQIGIAYEWKGEKVFHAFIEYPQIAPSGFPVTCAFIKVSSKQEFENFENIFLNTSVDFYNNSGRELRIGIILYIDNGMLLKRGIIRDNDTISFLQIEYVPDKSELYTRSKGLLEVGALEKKRVLIVGLGSGGASIAVELAKAGVGKFSLIDFDRIELHNISRHIAGVNELGRLKTNVVKDAILAKNPYARVDTFAIDMNRELAITEEEIVKSDLIIAATDSLSSRYNLNALIIKHKKIGIFGRAITRAEGGDILRVRPGGPCYACLKGSQWFNNEEEISDLDRARRDGVIPAYTSDEDAQAMVQVGLSTDIVPINTMVTKLAIMELSKNTECVIASIENELTYDFYMWANRRESYFVNWAPFNNNPGRKQPTILQWYGVRFEKNCHCMECTGY
jgi:molybdopterin/thiamine biosynthesis adenylyltransferase